MIGLRLEIGYGGAQPLVYNPATLFSAGQQGSWYDPSDFASMFQDSAGTVPVTATTQPVGRIDDKSGRGNHATQATAAARPVLQIDASGRYFLAFDGVDDFLESTADVIGAASSLYGFFGAKWSGVGSSDIGNYGVIGLTASAHVLSHVLIGGLYYSYTDATTAAATVAAQNTTNKHVAAFGVIIGAASSTLRFNKTVITVTQGASNVARTGTNGLRLGRREAAGAGNFNGSMYSAIFVGTALSAADISSAEDYVNSKTGAY